MIGTYREQEASDNPTISQLLSDIGREGQRVHLGFPPDVVSVWPA